MMMMMMMMMIMMMIMITKHTWINKNFIILKFVFNTIVRNKAAVMTSMYFTNYIVATMFSSPYTIT